MSAVMRIVGLINGAPTPFDGEWLVEYDPERDGTDKHGNPMSAVLRTTPNRADAHQFKSTLDAMEAWKAVCVREPVRWDGKPNRPLAAFTVEIVGR